MVMRGSGVELRAGPAPGAGRRGRVQALCLAFVTLVMSMSMGLVVAAPPAAAFVQLAVPLAATALRIAPSAVKVVGGGGASAVAGKTLLPWLGSGIGLAVAGNWMGFKDAMGWDPLDDGRGLATPWDVMVDAVTPDKNLPPGQPGAAVHLWTVTQLSWEPIDFQGGTFTTLRLNGTCVPNGSPCPKAGDAATADAVKVVAKCWDPSGGAWYEEAFSLVMNGRQRGLSGSPPCVKAGAGGYFQNPLASLETVNPANSNFVAQRVTNPEKYVNPDFDPNSVAAPTMTGTAECRDPISGATSTVTRVEVGVAVLPDVRCPEGWSPTKVGWTSTLPGGATKDMGGVQYDWGKYANCADMSCTLQVSVDGVPCRVGIEACYDWMRTEPKSRVQCDYGPYAVGLPECRDLERVYRSTPGVTPDSTPSTQPAPAWNPDGTPKENPTRLVPADPEGKPVPDMVPGTPTRPDPYPPTPRTSNPPSTTVTAPPAPTTPPFPTVGVNPPPPGPPGGPPQADPEAPTKNCIAGTWSLNPVDWVFVPVRCALAWAFIPKPAAAASIISTGTTAITGAGLGAWLDVPAQLWATIPTEGGCRGPELALPESMGGGIYYPINACQEPLSKAAEMSRAITSLVVGVAGLYSIINSLSVALTGYRLIGESSTKDVDR